MNLLGQYNFNMLTLLHIAALKLYTISMQLQCVDTRINVCLSNCYPMHVQGSVVKYLPILSSHTRIETLLVSSNLLTGLRDLHLTTLSLVTVEG